MAIISDSKSFHKTIEFSDNRLMIDLCGQLDCNLSRVEHEMSVQVLRRGNFLEVSGEEEDCLLAVTLLERLYSQLEAGKLSGFGDIDSTIRMSKDFFDPSFKRLATEEKNTNKLDDASLQIITRKKTILPRTAAQKSYVKKLFSGDITFGVGPAGTGKTYLGVAVGVSLYLNGVVDKIVLTRPAVEAGERLGFLPGDMKEKVDPYMQPLYDALQDCLTGRQITKMIDDKTIEIAPLAFMRGRTLSHSFVVLDEAQNATEMQMKMFLTRLGENSKMVITGDTTQIDLPRGVKSGLISALGILKSVEGISFALFNSNDVVRHHMVTRIIKAYEVFNES